jgi:hypothetical protein
MAIDPRISLAVQAPKTAPAINIFENALMNAQTRGINAQEAQQAQALAPLKLQQQQQNIDINTQALAAGQAQQELQTENRILRNVSEFGTKLAPVIKSGNIDQAQGMLTNRLLELQGKGLPTNETVEAITALRNGDSQSVLSGIDSIQQIAQQRGLLGNTQQTGTSSQRDFQTFQALSLKAQESGLPEDALAAEQFGIQSGFGRPTASQVQEQAISKAQQLADIEIDKSEKIETKKSELGSVQAAKKLAVTKSGKAFDKLANIDVAITNFDDAIKAIDEGAQTGTITSFLPSFRKSSIELDNIQKSLGLDVVGNTTFGALSESELAFALSKALPKNLQPQDLKVWLQSKKAVQQKLRNHISDAATFLGTGENTIPDWIELQKAKSVIQEQEQEQEQPVATETQASSVTEGQTATGPNGEKAIFTNGQWVVQ